MQGDAPSTRPRDRRAEGPPPRLVGEFVVGRKLGQGSYGEVYQAYQPSLRRPVALKLLLGADDGLDTARRFEREAWIGGRLNHPNVVRVFARGSDGGRPYVVMELVLGGTLAERIRRDRQSGDPCAGRARVRRIASWFAGVAEGLQHVHDRGVLHRDIKPHNLLLSSDDERLLLSDFGIAHDPASSGVTATGEPLGTLGYMSPEQFGAQHDRIDARSDTFSLGACLYEALSLERPFPGTTRAEVTHALLVHEPVPLRRRVRDLPRDLETIVARCLERDPARRPARAGDVAADLRRFIAGESIRMRSPGALARGARWIRRNRGLVSGATVAALAVGGAAAAVRHAGLRQELRATLAAAEATSLEPPALPRWRLMAPLLEKAVLAEPAGPLAIDAAHAATRVRVRLAGPGRDPLFAIDLTPSFRLEAPARLRAEVDARWDGGAWVRVGERDVAWGGPATADAEPRLFVRCSETFPDADRSDGVHVLSVRGRFGDATDAGGGIPSFVEHARPLEVLVWPVSLHALPYQFE